MFFPQSKCRLWSKEGMLSNLTQEKWDAASGLKFIWQTALCWTCLQAQLTEHILGWLGFPYNYSVSASQHNFNPCNSSILHVTSTPYSNYLEQTLLLFGLPKEGCVSRLWDRANSASASVRADNILCQSGSSKIVFYLHLHFHIQIQYKLRNIYNHFICTIAKKIHCFPPPRFLSYLLEALRQNPTKQ